MHVIVGGCGRLGAEIADLMSGDGHDVVVADVDGLAFDRLGSGFNGETVVGSITDRDVLEQAGVASADGLLAVTRFDNANLMAVEIATHLYGVERAVARLYNPERESSYQKLGIRYVSGTGFLAKEFLNELREGTFRHHLAFPYGEVAVVEMRVNEQAHGMTVGDLEIEGRLRVCALHRGERVSIPNEEQRLEEGDLIVAAARRGVHRLVRDLVEDERHVRRHGPEVAHADERG